MVVSISKNDNNMQWLHFFEPVFLIAIFGPCFYNHLMHELAVTESILNLVIKHATRNQVEKVLSISLKIGELTDLVDEWMQRYFNYLSKDTIAEGAILKIERSPVVFQCDDCKNTFPVSLKDTGKIVCSRCNSEKVMLVSGREFFIENIEVV